MTQFHGLYRATVTGTADPMKQGRVQVTVPDTGTAGEWALPCRTPGSVIAGRRFMDRVPTMGATVWVMFEAGDPARPVWLGIL
ncbi:phage baseplate assembly protein V [Muricoccus radiodurans]|uniref:phage baseplate assembly protein V n=1 Tax=Muricoccus radiodurans TaxID=2231721 RepID=UPI003CF683D8